MINWKPDIPFNDIPYLPPASDILDSPEVLKACILANKELARLDQAGKLIPNQGLLINLIPILEAKDSSEIENIVTTTDKLFEQASSDSMNYVDPATKEALSYRTALREGFDALARLPLCVNMAVDICSTLNGKSMDVRKIPGTTITNKATDEVIYTPPTGEGVIRDLLSNWEKFLHEENDIDPLIKLAVSHYQFEAIHPFHDGNGRTGRILNILYLVEQELLSLPTLYLSRYIMRNKQDYYRLIYNVTSTQEWKEWILFMLKAVEVTSRWTVAKIVTINELMKHTREYVKTKQPKIYTHELISIIFEQPYCRIKNLVERDIAKRQSASEYLKKLVAIDVLREEQKGKDKVFVNVKLMELMNQEENAFIPFTM